MSAKIKPEERRWAPPLTRGLLSWEEAAEYLNVKVRWLRRRVYDFGDIPKVKMGGRVMFNPDDLDVYIADRTSGGEELKR